MKTITRARRSETSKPGRPACQPGSGPERGQICAAVRTKREEMTNYTNLFAGNCGYLRVFALICGFGEFFAPRMVLGREGSGTAKRENGGWRQAHVEWSLWLASARFGPLWPGWQKKFASSQSQSSGFKAGSQIRLRTSAATEMEIVRLCPLMPGWGEPPMP
jgi:hypothetical protein